MTPHGNGLGSSLAVGSVVLQDVLSDDDVGNCDGQVTEQELRVYEDGVDDSCCYGASSEGIDGHYGVYII